MLIKINIINTEPSIQFGAYTCICQEASSTTRRVVSPSRMFGLSIRRYKNQIIFISFSIFNIFCS